MYAAPPARASFERVLGWSIAASILVHLLLLLLSPLVIRIGIPPGAAAVQDAGEAQAFGLEMIVAIPSADAPDTPPVERADEPVRPVPFRTLQPPAAVRPGAAVPSPVPGDQTRRSARDALRPGYRDPRLYVAPPIFPPDERTEHERYMDHLQARIDAVNDSMAVAANRERTTRDWVITDDSGNKWGLSGDGLHLGGVTIPRELIPNPTATGDNATRQEGAERQRQRDEIRRQEEDRQRRDTQDERIDATRDAQDRQRGAAGSGN